MSTTQNGTGTKPAATKETKTDVVLKPVAPVPPVPAPAKKDDVKISSLEDKFLRISQLNTLQEKWEKIKESITKLNEFDLKTDGRKESISFSDGSGNKFETFNSAVLRKTIDWLKEDLNIKLKEVEAHITF